MRYSVVCIFRVRSVSHNDADSDGSRSLTIPIPKNTNVRIIATQPFLLFPPYNSPCNGRRPPIP